MTTNSSDRQIDWLEIIKQAFLALMSGGLSLLWLVAKRLPSLWESSWLLRAEWITKGRDPKDWRWVGKGWMAAIGTAVVAIPAAMAVGSVLSLALRIQPRGTFSWSAVVISLIFLATVAASLGTICVYAFHTLRMAGAIAWSFTRTRYLLWRAS